MDGRTLDTWTEETTGSNLGEGGTDMSPGGLAGWLPAFLHKSAVVTYADFVGFCVKLFVGDAVASVATRAWGLI